MNAKANNPPRASGRIDIEVRAKMLDGRYVPVVHAHLLLKGEGKTLHTHTGPDGRAHFNGLALEKYYLHLNNATPFNEGDPYVREVQLSQREPGRDVDFSLEPQIFLETVFYTNGRKLDRPHGVVGDTLHVTVKRREAPADEDHLPGMFHEVEVPLVARDGVHSSMRITHAGRQEIAVRVHMRELAEHGQANPGVLGSDFVPGESAWFRTTDEMDIDDASPLEVGGTITTQASRTEAEFRPVIAHWTLIRNSAEALSFNTYKLFIDHLFCHNAGGDVPEFERDRFRDKEHAFHVLEKRRSLPFSDSESYRVLKAATEAFVMVNCGVLRTPYAFRAQEDADYLDRRDLPRDRKLEDELVKRYLTSLDQNTRILPYLALIRSKLPDVRIHIGHKDHHDAELCAGFIRDRLVNPCMMELIWSYWQEEGMLVQTMNAITRRFQNVRSPAHGNGPDPLANMEVDMLRPLNNLLWGYVQDEQHRLSVVRRNYEYDHHYGIHLDGKAVRDFRPADSRSKFIEAFHNLLRQLMPFYRQDDDTTVKADAFPILNALKEVHLILSQGAHNQFGDLPSTARIEMLMQQWMLARPEFREFLPTRLMVAHPEPWMDRVDAMKKVQGWSDTSIAHFRDLAMFGEQLLLSVRYTHWSDVYDPTEAFAWARFWRPQAQGYMHAYRAVTGVDLTSEVANAKLESTMPSILLRQRLEAMPRSA